MPSVVRPTVPVAGVGVSETSAPLEGDNLQPLPRPTGWVVELPSTGSNRHCCGAAPRCRRSTPASGSVSSVPAVTATGASAIENMLADAATATASAAHLPRPAIAAPDLVRYVLTTDPPLPCWCRPPAVAASSVVVSKVKGTPGPST